MNEIIETLKHNAKLMDLQDIQDTELKNANQKHAIEIMGRDAEILCLTEVVNVLRKTIERLKRKPTAEEFMDECWEEEDEG